MGSDKIYFRRNLPHFYPKGATYFITFRLADSLPQNVINDLKNKYFNENQSRNKEVNINLEKEAIRNEHFKKFEEQLDKNSYGNCVLKDLSIAEILYNRLLEFDQNLYALICFVIMPNHVHLLLTDKIDPPTEINSDEKEVPAGISKAMQMIKGGSAYLINKQLKRKGSLWAAESYDRIIRQDAENIINYILNNPVKANLGSQFREKPFTYINPEYISIE